MEQVPPIISLIKSLLRNCETCGSSNFFLRNCNLSLGITIGVTVGFVFFRMHYIIVLKSDKYMTGNINAHRKELLSLLTLHSLFVYSLHFSL